MVFGGVETFFKVGEASETDEESCEEEEERGDGCVTGREKVIDSCWKRGSAKKGDVLKTVSVALVVLY